jgi:arylsulfatase A-like enzyme
MEKAKTDKNAKFLTDRIYRHPAVELYDIQSDPNELTNLAEEPKYKAKVSEMKSTLEEWMLQQGDTGISMDVPIKK